MEAQIQAKEKEVEGCSPLPNPPLKRTIRTTTLGDGGHEKSTLQPLERGPRSRHSRIRSDVGRYFGDRGGYDSARGIPGKQRIF